MQSFRMTAIAALAVFASGTAFAQTAAFNGEARLLNPAGAPAEAKIAGVDWRCEGDQCLGAAARRSTVDGLVRECKRVAAVVGPIATYRSRGRELTASQIRACNRGVIQIQTAAN